MEGGTFVEGRELVAERRIFWSRFCGSDHHGMRAFVLLSSRLLGCFLATWELCDRVGDSMFGYFTAVIHYMARQGFDVQRTYFATSDAGRRLSLLEGRMDVVIREREVLRPRFLTRSTIDIRCNRAYRSSNKFRRGE